MHQVDKDMDNFKILAEVFTDFPEILLVIIFGSMAKGNASLGSDLDVAVAGLHIMPLDVIVRLQLVLESEFGREVDIVDLQNVNGPILQQILTSGKVLKPSPALYADLIKKMWFNQADMMPLTKFVLQKHCQRFVNG